MEIKKYIEVFFRDFAAFAGISFYLILTAIFFFVNFELAKKLLYGLIITYVVVVLIRSFYFKERPNKEEYRNFLEKLDASSFPSIHSCRATIISFLLSDYLKNNFVTALLILSMSLVIYSRIYLKKHYWFDVVAGFLLGVAIYLFLLFL